MKRRKARNPQHGKNRSRPRGWHRGAAAGKTQAKDLSRIEAAEAQVGAMEPDLALARREIQDHTALWRELDRVAPFVPAWIPEWL